MRNLHLLPGRSRVRKGLEAGLTALVELTWRKRRILEVYLNVVEFGPGIFWASAASSCVFGKPTRQLDTREAGLLATVLPHPKRVSGGRPSECLRGRAGDIEVQIRTLGGAAYLYRL